MTICSPARVILLCGAATLMSGTGCATRSDLETLNQELSQKLATTDASVQTQIGELRKELREELARTLQAVHAETVKVTKELQDAQRVMEQTLLSNYKMEEATLKGRLRVLTQTRERLESVISRQHPEVAHTQ